MEALSNYFITLDRFKDRIFISNPPNAAMLIWTNRDFLPNISGISIVEQEGMKSQIGLSGQKLKIVLENQLYGTVPVLHIIYSADMKLLKIDDNDYTLEDAARNISEIFHIKLGSSPAKAPNDLTQIVDPFHIWSRDAFDGISVMKTDIDFLMTNNGKVSSIWEVKRSKVVPVGKWAPYVNPNSNNDINNYLLLMSLSNLLKCRMITVHHEEMNNAATFNGSEQVDFYVYHPKPDQDSLNSFAMRKTSTTSTINKVLNI